MGYNHIWIISKFCKTTGKYYFFLKQFYEDFKILYKNSIGAECIFNDFKKKYNKHPKQKIIDLYTIGNSYFCPGI